ncbi:MAG: hypothetical protein NC349_08380 [Paenibacillus sp.]|nr:hypothetical protein [Paenibacillus sp.]
MIRPLFSFIGIALAIMAGAMLQSCNKDDVIEAAVAPGIEIDSEDGIYTVKVGHELTISPVYKDVTADATYRWSIDGSTIATTPALTYTWAASGEYYLDITVTTPGGSATEELKVEVVELAVPVISLPLSADEVTIALGSDYVITPDISNSDIEGFKVEWTLDGQPAGEESSFTFNATATGSFKIAVTASNIDGSDTREITVNVVEKLPIQISFPTPGYLIKSTDRYTFAGRPVYLTPIIEGAEPTSYEWSVNGKAVECEGRTLEFTPETAGEYIVNLTVDHSVISTVKVICPDATEAQRFRKATATSSATSTTVYEWIPAPGQYINETQTGGMTGSETTPELANEWAQSRLDKQLFVSLGGFGGYIVVGFDHSIPRSEGDYDFSVMANAFLNAASGSGGSNEPGIVYVMQDVNGNGLPDDEWYELRGSETGKADTRQDYAVTYYRPSGPKMATQWTDNYGASGTVDYLKAFHRQDYYYPAWVETDTYTLRGTCLSARTTQDSSSGFWDNSAYPWGYADNIGSDNITGSDATSGAGQRNGFLIKNAMYPTCQHVNLQYIDFIKVQTGVNSKAGWLGEVSTEVFNFRDLSM